MPLIMVGQNLQGKHAEVRAENDYEINLKAEKEIAELKKDLEEIKALLKLYLQKDWFWVNGIGENYFFEW